MASNYGYNDDDEIITKDESLQEVISEETRQPVELITENRRKEQFMKKYESLQEVISNENRQHVEPIVNVLRKEQFTKKYNAEAAVKTQNQTIVYSRTGFKSECLTSKQHAEEEITRFNIPDNDDMSTNNDVDHQDNQQPTEESSLYASICTKVFHVFSKFLPEYFNRSSEEEEIIQENEQACSEHLIIPGREEKIDTVILHTEEDTTEVTEYKTHLEVYLGSFVRDLRVELYESVLPCNQSKLGSIPDLFQICRFIFVYVTPNFTAAEMEKYQAEIALLDAITNLKQKDRIVPVWADKTSECRCPALQPLRGSRYYRVKNLKYDASHKPYFDYLERLIIHGCSNY